MIDVRKKDAGDDWIDPSTLIGRIALANKAKIPALAAVGRIVKVSKTFLTCEGREGKKIRLGLQNLEGVCDTVEELELLRGHYRRWQAAQHKLYADAQADLESLQRPENIPSPGR
jgi:hypothetical protein